MYGAPARMTPILDLAKKYKLKVVEDAAPAIGAKWNGKSCGTFGDFGAYSFQGAKLLVTGEGGMLVTNDDDLYVKAKKIWDQGRNPNKTFWIDEDGVKFKMSNVQAAIGLAQIERADELIEMKRRIFSWYEDRLSGFKGIHLNKEVEGAKSIYWMSSIRLDEGMKLSRDDLIIELKKRNVDTRPVFPAISKYPIWPLKQDPKPIADKIGNTAMNLPSGVCLKKDDIMYVCDQIIELLELS
jgi:perosamine synthetase